MIAVRVASMIVLSLSLATAAAGCAAKRTALVAVPPPAHALAAALARVPAIVVAPALDRRPAAERGGDGGEVGFLMASSGGAMSRTTGASVLGGDDGLQWAGTPATAVAADLSHALEGASGRAVGVSAVDADGAAAVSADGTVVITIVIDHIAQITARNHDFSQTKTQEGNYEVTRTQTQTETFGPFWTISFRVQLGEVHGGRITRRLVRYAAASSTTEAAYSDALAIAANQIVEAVAAEWANVGDDAVAEGL